MIHPARQTDQHFLVTGAGSGIGRAIALRLGQEGARVSLVGRTASKLEETAALLREAGARAHVCPADIRDRASVREAVADAVAALGPLRGVVANAGVGGPNSPGDDDRWDDLIQTNLSGTYHTARAAQDHLVDGGTRHMVFIASVLGRFGVPGYTGYCAAKTGIIGLARALAHEVAAEGVQVNAVCPGWVNTQMARDGIQGMADGMGISYDEALAEAMKAVPVGRMSEPEHVAGLVAWLVSADATGVTGQALDMNGGAWM
jgi:NAD(P)-dependent dehydrogenase (short-subunit alcohol dehydrogenase family)